MFTSMHACEPVQKTQAAELFASEPSVVLYQVIEYGLAHINNSHMLTYPQL